FEDLERCSCIMRFRPSIASMSRLSRKSIPGRCGSPPARRRRHASFVQAHVEERGAATAEIRGSLTKPPRPFLTGCVQSPEKAREKTKLPMAPGSETAEAAATSTTSRGVRRRLMTRALLRHVPDDADSRRNLFHFEQEMA